VLPEWLTYAQAASGLAYHPMPSECVGIAWGGEHSRVMRGEPSFIFRTTQPNN
jgi:hypothetical protein